MSIPLAAELLLLALDDKSGRPYLQSSTLNTVIAAATLVDLTLSGHLDVDAPDERARQRRFRATLSTPTDPIMAEAVARVDGKKPQQAVLELSRSISPRWHSRGQELKRQLLDQLVGAGLLREVDDTTLGFIPITRWLPGNPAAENEVVDRVRAAVTSDFLPDQRTAALVGLAHTVHLLPKVLPDVDKKILKSRGKELAEGEWAPQGLRDALQAANGAAAAGIAAAV